MKSLLQGWRVFVWAAAALIATPMTATAATQVIYIGAPDCPYCSQYEGIYEHDLMAACRAKGVSYRRVKLAKRRFIHKAEHWPADLRPLFSAGGTPRFIIIENGTVTQNLARLTSGRMAVAQVCAR